MRAWMNQWFLRTLAVVLLSAIVYGCATIVGGTDQMVSFQSEPEGATVKLDGRPLGKTPLTVRLDKKDNQTLTFELEGYETATMPATTTVEPWFFGNILIGGLIGTTTDIISGGIIEYAPDQYYVTLKPLEGKKPDRSSARDFIVAGYSHIIEELNTVPSEYLESLFSLLDIPAEDQDEALKKIKGLSLVYSDVAEFSEQVVAYFENEKLKSLQTEPSKQIMVAGSVDQEVRWDVPRIRVGDTVDVIPTTGVSFEVKVEKVDSRYIEGYARYYENQAPEWYTEKFYFKDMRKLNGQPVTKEVVRTQNKSSSPHIEEQPLFQKGDNVDILTAVNREVRIHITRVGPDYVEGIVQRLMGSGGSEFPEKFMFDNIKKVNGKPVTADELKKMFN